MPECTDDADAGPDASSDAALLERREVLGNGS
jgi:hypothetical protein